MQRTAITPPGFPERFEYLRRPRSPRPETTVARRADLPPPLAISAGLDPYTEPLDRRKAAHLLRRVGFGATPEDLDALLGMPGHEAAAMLVDEAVALPMPEPPEWANAFPPPWDGPDEVLQAYFDQQFPWFADHVVEWLERMYQYGLREKMALFWHDHFATEWEVYFFTPMAFRHVALLREEALGNFRNLVFQMGLDPAMLIYLDGESNTGFEPNENYARELLELFTMGQYDGQGNPNYTQRDIVELSRALTGWYVQYEDFTAHFDHYRYDTGVKEIFGQHGAFNYIDVHELIFDQRARPIAEFIARKLYTEFVYVTPDEAVIAEMADLFLANDFEIAPVVKALLRSAHFFDDEAMGSKIKSPVALLVGMLKDTDVNNFVGETFRMIHYSANELEQDILQPPNVAGWPGYRSWISTSTLATRWETVDYYLGQGLVEHVVSIAPLAQKLLDPDDPLAAFKLPVLLAEHFIAVPAESLGYDAPMEDFGGDLINNPIPAEIANGPAYVRDLAKIFLGGSPWYEWDVNRAGSWWTLYNYLVFLTRLPEYQLT